MSDLTALIPGGLPPDDDPEVQHFLVVVSGPDRGRRFRFDEGLLEIGRTVPGGLALDDRSVSARHCRLVREGDSVTVEDLDSRNGTYIGGQRLAMPAALPVGSTLRVGGTAIRRECRTEGELAELEQLADLERAARYVASLLPAPRREGPEKIEWCFVPSAHIGGDSFGYHELDDDHLAIYLLDVSGHGAGSALHSVTILNVLRHQSLPGVDFGRPDQVLSGLNEKFEMRRHNGLFFTMWYGVWERSSRTLRYTSGGHPPGVIVLGEGSDVGGEPEVVRARTPGIALGMTPRFDFPVADLLLSPGSRLYLFSDGVYDIAGPDGRRWEADDFCGLIQEEHEGDESEPERLLRRVRETDPEAVDDFTLVVVTFG